MLETILVTAVLAGVVLLAARSFVRTLTGKNAGCGCGAGCQGCAGGKGNATGEEPAEGTARSEGGTNR